MVYFAPVSYTHLDVYKRQAQCRLSSLAGIPGHSTSRPFQIEDCDIPGPYHHAEGLSLIHILKAFMAFDTFPNAFNSPRYRRKLSLFILSSNLTTADVYKRQVMRIA